MQSQHLAFRTSTDMNSLLLRQPPEILKGITDFIDGHALLQLWLCGNKFLNWMIGSGGGCMYFGIDFDAGLFHIKWPALLYSLHKLEFLRLRLKMAGTMGDLIAPDLPSLPPCLKSIKFLFRSAEAHMFKDKNGYRSTELHDLKTMFPQLTDLVLEGECYLDDRILDVLPASLVNFQLPLNTKLTKNALSRLPADLNTLRMPYVPECPDAESLPRYLTRLQLPCAFTEENASSWPPTLTTLVLRGSSHASDNAVGRLPRAILHLALIGSKKLTSACFPLLPPSLVYLNLDHIVGPVTGESITHLPRKMLHLYLNNCTVTDLAPGNLPPSLTLYCNYGVQAYSNTFIASFPSSLQSLMVDGSQLSLDGLVHLPRNLTSLRLPYTPLTSDHLVDLPVSLTLLEANWAQIDDQTLPRLPQGLRSLSLDRAAALTEEGIRLLPASLTHFSARRLKIKQRDTLALLPRRLVSIWLSAYEGETPSSDCDLPATLQLVNLQDLETEQAWLRAARDRRKKNPVGAVRTFLPP